MIGRTQLTAEPAAFDALRPNERQAQKSRSFRPRAGVQTGQQPEPEPGQLSWWQRIPRPTPKGVFEHILFVGGLASITIGFALAYPPLGPLVGGIFAVGLALLLSDPEPDK